MSLPALVALEGAESLNDINTYAERGPTSGRVYDALFSGLRSKDQGSDRLHLDPGHFQSLVPELVSRIPTP